MTAILDAPPATPAPTTEKEYQNVAVGNLRPHPLNRKHFDTKRAEELEQSVREKGVLVPLLVRPAWPENPNMRGQYQVLAGERRWRAAKKAGLAEVPVRILQLDDRQAIEVLVTDNLQHEDVHPLEEALAYAELLRQPGYDVDGIAAKVGKSTSYVYQRLKLAELIPGAQKAFWDEKLTAGHAILIARLQPKDQAETLKAAQGGQYRSPISVRELAGWIEREIHLDLNSAPFKKADAALLPDAGPCTTCPKRTGFTPALFPDIAKADTCTDRSCFQMKLAAHMDVRVKELEAEGEKAVQISRSRHGGELKGTGVLGYDQFYQVDKKADGAKLGLIVEGHDAGKTMYITRDRMVAATRNTNADVDRYQREQRAQQQRRTKAIALRKRYLEAILPKLPTRLEKADLVLLLDGFVKEMHLDNQKRVCQLRGWEAKKSGQYGSPDYAKAIATAAATMAEAELVQLLLALPLLSDLEVYSYSSIGKPEKLLAAAKRYGVNLGAVDRAVAAEERAKADRKKAKTKPVHASAKAKKRAGDVARERKAKKAKAAKGRK